MKDITDQQLAVVRVSTQVDRRAEVFGPFETISKAIERFENLRAAAGSDLWVYDIIRLRR